MTYSAICRLILSNICCRYLKKKKKRRKNNCQWNSWLLFPKQKKKESRKSTFARKFTLNKINWWQDFLAIKSTKRKKVNKSSKNRKNFNNCRAVWTIIITRHYLHKQLKKAKNKVEKKKKKRLIFTDESFCVTWCQHLVTLQTLILLLNRLPFFFFFLFLQQQKWIGLRMKLKLLLLLLLLLLLHFGK